MKLTWVGIKSKIDLAGKLVDFGDLASQLHIFKKFDRAIPRTSPSVRYLYERNLVGEQNSEILFLCST